MSERYRSIDCDLHPAVEGVAALHPYMDEYWREVLTDRDVAQLDTLSYPPNAPKTVRADWRGPTGRGGATLAAMQREALDRWQTDIGILNPLLGVQMVLNEDMAVVITRALNDWVRAEWLDRDPRLRASIVVPLQSVERAVDEIERLAPDPRFVQVMVLSMGESPLGRRMYWPIWAAAEKHGLPLCIHAGSSYHHPVTSLGWPTYYIEDYLANSQGFQSQLASLVCEGVFAKFPGLKVVLAESGVTWLPAFLWRLGKFWRGVRTEIPWVDRLPAEIVRDHVRLTVQPFDAPDASVVERILDHVGSDEMLLYSSDYPHWQFDGDQVMPPGLPEGLLPKIRRDNPLATYSRLKELVA